MTTGSRVAVVGLGGMGAGVALRLLDQGIPVTVHNRTTAKAEPIVAAGATLASSAAAAAEEASVVLVSLSDEDAVAAVVFGQLCPVLRPGTVIVDTSTVSPSFSREAESVVGAAGGRRVEACLVGNPFQARAGEMRVLAGGERPSFAEVEPLLALIGKEVTYLGPTGGASTMKLVMNLLLGAQVATLAEAVNYGVGAGLDRDTMLAAIAESGFSSKVMAFRAGLMRARRYDPPAFRAKLMAKDLTLALTEATQAGIVMPVLSRTAERFADVVSAGHGDSDAAVIAEIQ